MKDQFVSLDSLIGLEFSDGMSSHPEGAPVGERKAHDAFGLELRDDRNSLVSEFMFEAKKKRLAKKAKGGVEEHIAENSNQKLGPAGNDGAIGIGKPKNESDW